MDTLLEFLKNNQFASGGMLLAFLAFAYRYATYIFSSINTFIKRRFITTITVSSSEGYNFHCLVNNWVIDLLNKHKKNITNLSIAYSQKYITYGYWLINEKKLGYLFIKIVSEDIKIADTLVGKKQYTISITLLSKNKAKLTEIFNTLADGFDSDKIEHLEEGGTPLGTFPKKHINISNVILNKKLQEEIFSDLDTFLKSKSKYYTLGNIYKRVYLLQGPPGNGKTSIIKLISNYLNRIIVISDLKSINAGRMANALIDSKGRAIFVLEDIDREDLSEQDPDKPSRLGVLLNMFDGLATPECIIIMTCNDINKLDPAFLRPGRIDRIFEVKNADKEQAKRLFLKYYPNEVEKIDMAIKDYVCHTISMSSIQQCLQIGIDIDEAIKLFKEKIDGLNENKDR